MGRFAVFIFFALFELLAFVTASTCTEEEFATIKADLSTAVDNHNNPGRQPARMLRAAFHDCFPQHCDGSLQFELGRSENAGLSSIITFLNNQRSGTCASLADMIKMGAEVAMEKTNGPTLTCRTGQTSDVTVANIENQMPGENDAGSTLITTFQNKGFTIREALAGNFAGHSIGQSNPGGTFDSTPTTFNRHFVRYVVLGEVPPAGAPPGNFHALASDLALEVEQPTRTSLLASNVGGRFNGDFVLFMEKLCQM